MQYAKSKRSNATSDLVNDHELDKVQVETGAQKRDQLAFLNRKVKQFEDCKIYVSPILSSVKSFYCKMISRNILQLIHNLSFFHSV